MDSLDWAWFSMERQRQLPSSSVLLQGLDSPEGLGPVALNPQRRRHLDPTAPALLFRSFPEMYPPKGLRRVRAVGSTPRGDLWKRAVSPFLSIPAQLPCRARPPHRGRFPAGVSEECQLLTKPTCWSALSGPLVCLFGEHRVPRTSSWSVASTTGARLRPLLKVGEEPQVIWPPGFLCFPILSLPS